MKRLTLLVVEGSHGENMAMYFRESAVRQMVVGKGGSPLLRGLLGCLC